MHKPRFFLPCILLSLAVLFWFFSSFLPKKQNSSFQQLTDTLFRQEVTASTLTLHYSLLSPEKYGITSYPVTYADETQKDTLTASRCMNILKNISRDNLSLSDQQTYDILYLVFQNALDGEQFPYYPEPLGPSIGIQAQLPILLSEYCFTSLQDIQTYLQLISTTDSYFASLLSYERKKSALGLFMTDRCADSIISQCQTFISCDVSDNLLAHSFSERISRIDWLTHQEQDRLCKENLRILANHVIPAYRLLIQGLEALKGSGKNQKGLCYYPKGRAYYEYLIRSQTGTYLSVDTILARIKQQISCDLSDCRKLLIQYPQLKSATPVTFSKDSPEFYLEDLKEKMQQSFPAPPDTEYEVKYVPSSLESFLSPAFYLTAPIDKKNQNIIYINQASSYTPLTLYTTLAHETFPGHLYQHLFSSSGLSPLRSLLNFGGYTEGWATYAEMESYSFAANGCSEPETAAITLARKSRSLLLGLSSLMDISVHYKGYSKKQVQTLLSGLGLNTPQILYGLYDTILESPGNYLKYYLGYLNFMDLRSYCQERWPDQFHIKDFHKRILEIGPCPFPVLEKYIKASYQ